MMTMYVSPYRRISRRARRVENGTHSTGVQDREKVLAVDVKSDDEAYTISAIIPGIEAEGLARGMPVTILLAADTPAELSGPQKPWSLKLDLQGPDMSLAVEGRMEKALVWDTFDYRIAISGNQVDALEKLMKGRTSIVIAHRLSTIRKADNIVVIDKGKIAEQGTHDQLIGQSEGIYKNLSELQFAM